MENQKIQSTTMQNIYFGLRPHQYAAFEACKTKKYGIISDTCGSGKTNVECELICDALLTGKKLIVLAAHRLDLIDQHLTNLTKYMQDWHPELLAVKRYVQFEVSSANRKDHGMQNYTNRQDIQNMVIGCLADNKQMVITLCYQSLANLYAAFEGSDKRIDLMICDEGHIGMSAEHGKNEAQQLCEKSNIKIEKYDMIHLCDSFIVFSATPFKKTMVKLVDGIKMDVIHDYSYAEANRDGIVLPFTANFYVAKDFNEKSQLGMIKQAYTDLKQKFNKTSAKLLVCGVGLENNQLHFNTLVKQYKTEIEEGNLAICKIGSESCTKDLEKIPSCEFVNKDVLARCQELGLKEFKLNYKDDRINKKMCMEATSDWIDTKLNPNNIKHNIIIIHCQMLGVGVDVPNINGVCVLGNKESADLYQSIMRPCRIAYFDRDVPVSQRLEDHFEAYFHADTHDMKPIEQFCDKLAELGGISLLESLTLNTPTYGSKQDSAPSTFAQSILDKTVKSLKVQEACDKIVFNVEDIQEGLKQFTELSLKYPEEASYIEQQLAKFIHKPLVA